MKALTIWLSCCLLPVVALAADSQNELAKLKGKWQMTALEQNGTKLPAEALNLVKLGVLELGNGKLAIRVADRVVHEGSFKIDAKASPKTIEGSLMAGHGQGAKSNQPAIGIYEVSGDTLRICFGGPGSRRAPQEFKSAGVGGGWLLVTYRRMK
jgi:uncharacterized protein (TIGR03067 family)